MFVLGLLLAGVLLSSACGTARTESTPTEDAGLLQTQAVATFSQNLTETSWAQPSSTATLTPAPSPTATSSPAVTNTAPVQATILVVPTSSCNGLTFVADVTVPDNTKMSPGQKFTKTWKVKNSGTCDWENGFQFRFIGGEAMSGITLKLEKTVKPGAETELSVALTAPTTPGTYRSNWRMSTESGAYFGDEVYVLIVVSGTPAASSSPTATGTRGPTATTTATATITPTSTESPTETLEP